MPQQQQFFPLRGGLNLITPAMETPSGHCIAALNYEAVERGYTRAGGYERFSGLPKPSVATYSILHFDAGTATIAANATVTGQTSSATGKMIRAMVVESGAFGGSNAVGFLVLTQITGTFQNNENLQVSGVTKCVANGVTSERGAASDDEDRAWSQAAIEIARSAISTVPGSGPVRGGFTYKGEIYAIRDNIGATAAVIHKATATGWDDVTFSSSVLQFVSGGTFDPQDMLDSDTSEQLSGATSGATANITAVILQGGTWATGDAFGYMVISGTVGTFAAAENLNLTLHPNIGTAVAAAVAIALPPGGRYEAVEHNFYGTADLKRIYACNGVGPAFQFNGVGLIPIYTGTPVALDKPTHIAIHANHLVLGFRGGSVQLSGDGDPLSWLASSGASEIGLGEDVTGLIGSVAGTLAIYGKRKVAILYGSDVETYDYRELSNDSGAFEWSMQQMGDPIHMDQGGLRSLQATAAYGDFRRTAISRMIEPMIRRLLDQGILPVASIRVKGKDQYRIWFSDGNGINLYFGRKNPEPMPIQSTHVPTCTWSGVNTSGQEVNFFGASNGLVYQLDSGTSHDGSSIEAFIRLPFNHVGSPGYNKRWYRVLLEADAGAGSRIGLTAEFGYANPDQPPALQVNVENVSSFGLTWDVSLWDSWEWPAVDVGAIEDVGAGGFWEENNWDEFYWSTPVNGRFEAFIDGIGSNVSIVVLSQGTYAIPHTLHGLILFYSPRGMSYGSN